MKSLVVGEQPDGYDTGDAYHHILMSLLMAARANDLQVIDGPYLAIGISMACAASPDAPPPSDSTASGRCIRRRSTSSTTSFPAPGRLRPRREHPRRLQLVHIRRRRRRDAAMLGDDDRRGLLQDGAGRLGEGPGCGDVADRRVDSAAVVLLIYQLGINVSCHAAQPRLIPPSPPRSSRTSSRTSWRCRRRPRTPVTVPSR